MKLTKSKLKQLIKEELGAARREKKVYVAIDKLGKELVYDKRLRRRAKKDLDNVFSAISETIKKVFDWRRGLDCDEAKTPEIDAFKRAAWDVDALIEAYRKKILKMDAQITHMSALMQLMKLWDKISQEFNAPCTGAPWPANGGAPPTRLRGHRDIVW